MVKLLVVGALVVMRDRPHHGQHGEIVSVVPDATGNEWIEVKLTETGEDILARSYMLELERVTWADCPTDEPVEMPGGIW